MTKEEIIKEMNDLEEESFLFNNRVSSLKSMIARYVEKEDKKNETKRQRHSDKRRK